MAGISQRNQQGMPYDRGHPLHVLNLRPQDMHTPIVPPLYDLDFLHKDAARLTQREVPAGWLMPTQAEKMEQWRLCRQTRFARTPRIDHLRNYLYNVKYMAENFAVRQDWDPSYLSFGFELEMIRGSDTINSDFRHAHPHGFIQALIEQLQTLDDLPPINDFMVKSSMQVHPTWVRTGTDGPTAPAEKPAEWPADRPWLGELPEQSFDKWTLVEEAVWGQRQINYHHRYLDAYGDERRTEEFFPGFPEAICAWRGDRHDDANWHRCVGLCQCEFNLPGTRRTGVELVSRVVTQAELDDGTLLRETAQLLTALDWYTHEWRLHGRRHQNIGLHVHVGAGRGHIFSFQHARMLAAILIYFEETLDRVHPVNRQDWSHRAPLAAPLTSDATSPISARRNYGYFRNAPDLIRSNRMACARDWLDQHGGYARRPYTLRDVRSVTDAQLFDWVMLPRTTNDLLHHMQCAEREARIPAQPDQPFKGYKYNFLGLSTHPYLVDTYPKGTVEFRQHCQTDNPLEILRWCRLIGRIVTVAHGYTEATLGEKLLGRGGHRRDIHSFLMGFLNMGTEEYYADASYWLHRVAQFEEEREAWVTMAQDDDATGHAVQFVSPRQRFVAFPPPSEMYPEAPPGELPDDGVYGDNVVELVSRRNSVAPLREYSN